jgi:uncharacterized protein
MADLQTFHDSVKKGNLPTVRAVLAEHPAWLNEKNSSGQTAILLAKYYGQQETADYLLTLDPQLDVFTAAAIGDLDRVVQEIQRDPALLGTHSSDGWTPLHIAAFFGSRQIAEKLIENGAEVDARSTNAMRNTPLHAAAAGRKPELVQLLLDEGADVNATQQGGWTALHGAAQNGDRELVELLLAKGADLQLRADNGQTALDLALLKGRQDVADLLDQLSPDTQ